MRHLTRIVGVPFGVNILGLLEFFALIGILSLPSFVNSIPGIIGGLILCLGFAGIIAFDLWWRSRLPNLSWRARLLSPYEGGCFVFVPIWLLFALASLIGIVALLIAVSKGR